MKKLSYAIILVLAIFMLSVFSAAAASPRIKINTPRGAEFTVDVAKTIEWEITGDAAAIDTFKILYWHRGLSQWTEIASDISKSATSYSVTLSNDGFSGAAFIAVYASNDQGKKVTYSYLKVSLVKPRVKIGSGFKGTKSEPGSTIDIPVSFTGDTSGIGKITVLFYDNTAKAWQTIVDNAHVVDSKITIETPAQTGKGFVAVMAYDSAGKKLSSATSPIQITASASENDCDDSDGVNYLVAGNCIVLSPNKIYDRLYDTCIDEYNIKEYMCDPDPNINICKYIAKDCRDLFGADYVCSNGACNPSSGEGAGSCRDTDKGNDPFIYGTTTAKNIAGDTVDEHPDECSNFEPSLAEYYCEGNEIKSQYIPCDYGCSNGACNPGSCIDTDYGKKPFIYGTTHTTSELGGIGQIIENRLDKCYDSTHVTEYFCPDEKGKILSENIPCDYGCSAGECNTLPDKNTCKDTDNGKTYTMQGTITLSNSNGGVIFTDVDECKDSTTVREFYCSPDAAVGYIALDEPKNCKDLDPNYICIDGACKSGDSTAKTCTSSSDCKGGTCSVCDYTQHKCKESKGMQKLNYGCDKTCQCLLGLTCDLTKPLSPFSGRCSDAGTTPNCGNGKKETGEACDGNSGSNGCPPGSLCNNKCECYICSDCTTQGTKICYSSDGTNTAVYKECVRQTDQCLKWEYKPCSGGEKFCYDGVCKATAKDNTGKSCYKKGDCTGGDCLVCDYSQNKCVKSSKNQPEGYGCDEKCQCNLASLNCVAGGPAGTKFFGTCKLADECSPKGKRVCDGSAYYKECLLISGRLVWGTSYYCGSGKHCNNGNCEY